MVSFVGYFAFIPKLTFSPCLRQTQTNAQIFLFSFARLSFSCRAPFSFSFIFILLFFRPALATRLLALVLFPMSAPNVGNNISDWKRVRKVTRCVKTREYIYHANPKQRSRGKKWQSEKPFWCSMCLTFFFITSTHIFRVSMSFVVPLAAWQFLKHTNVI